MNTKTHTDIKRNIWITRYLPPQYHAYVYLMRLDRPIGVWLLLIPCLWGMILASGVSTLSPWHYALYTPLFIIGAIIMRGAGCVINDIWDRDLDKQVARTRTRPLASGALSVKHALIFLAVLLCLGLGILLQFNMMTVILGFCALPLIMLYPLMKRVTWWPQAFLGLTFNCGALMGWSAITGGLTLPPVLLYIGSIFWTLGYDTIYAHQDIDDDAMAGIKSTARKFGTYSKQWVAGFYTLALCFWVAAALSTFEGQASFAIFALPAAHMVWQLKTWQYDNAQTALNVFKSNTFCGVCVALSLLTIAAL